MPANAQSLAVLHETVAELTRCRDRRQLFEHAAAGARALVHAAVASALSWDAARRELVVEASAGPGASEVAAELVGCAATAYHDRRTRVLADLDEDPHAVPLARRLPLGAAAATPLPAPGDGPPVGILCVIRERGAPVLGAEDLRLLELLAAHTGLALAAAEDTAAAARRVARAEQLAIALRSLVECHEQTDVLERGLDLSLSLLGVDRVAIFLFNDRDEMASCTGRGLSRGYLMAVGSRYRQSVGRLVPLARAPVYVADLVTDPRTRVLHEQAAHEGVHTLLIVPILHGDVLRGALALYHDLVWHYQPEDFAAARTLAEALGVALGNASEWMASARQSLRLQALTAMSRVLLDGGGARRGLAALVNAKLGVATGAWLLSSSLELVAHAGSSGRQGETQARALARRALREERAVASDGLAAAPVPGTGALAVAPARPPRPRAVPPSLFISFTDESQADEAEALAREAAQLLSGRLVRSPARRT